MGMTVAVTNQKGGVGKTTTAAQLGSGLADRGKKVLFIDMDAQCNLSYLLKAENDEKTVLHAMTGKMPAAGAVVHCEKYDVMPGSTYMSAVDSYLPASGREYSLKKVIDQIKDYYDYIIIDSPPTLGTATVSTLTAADTVLVPSQADVYSLQGMGQLFSTIKTVRKFTNPGLKIDGILMTRHSDRLLHSRQMREMIAQTAEMMGTKVYDTCIHESVALREAATSQTSIYGYRRKSRPAEDYSRFTDEFLAGQNN